MVLLIFFLWILHVSQLPGQEYRITDYTDFENQVNRLEKKGQYEHALQLTQMIRDRFPEREFEVMKELIYLHFKTGRHNENLTLWAEGHQKGYFFLLNTRMEKYKPLADNEQFLELVKVDERLRAESFKHSRTIYDLVLPDTLMENKRYPLILILHGGGSNLEGARSRWHIFRELKQSYILAFLQSYRHADYNTFVWASPDERAHHDIKQCADEIIARYPVDTTQIILAGMSSGGTMAFEVALNNILPVHGVIGFCPGKPWNVDTDIIRRIKPKIYMIGGASDYYRSKQEEMVKLFKMYNITYEYEIIPDMGHEFPADYEYHMKKALSLFTGETNMQ